MQTVSSLLSGGVIGLVLGLVGGGGSILAVPLLVYVVGVGSTHAAIGTAAVAVTANALASLIGHARAGRVKWRCASVFAASGVIGAALGAELGKAVDGKRLLALFGVLMIGVGLSMLRKRRAQEAPDVRLTRDSATTLLPRLVPIGLGVGCAAGFFGIGGGFLIVPGLILATAMPLSFAIGTSLVVVTALGLTTASSYALSGLVDAGIGSGPWSQAIQDRFQVAEFSQFTGAQMVADKYGLTREAMDAFALDSHRRAAAAIAAGGFNAEIVPVATAAGLVSQDEGVRFDASMEGIGSVKPLVEGGIITAANASQMTDGASGALIVSEAALARFGLTPLARIHTLTVTAGDPVIMLEEPIPATAKALARAGLSLDDIDLFEVNEAFAAIPMAWAQATGADPARLNVNGGAIALGHPLGASGTKLMATLVHALHARGGRYGLQTMCEGGGVANVTIVERL